MDLFVVLAGSNYYPDANNIKGVFADFNTATKVADRHAGKDWSIVAHCVLNQDYSMGDKQEVLYEAERVV